MEIVFSLRFLHCFGFGVAHFVHCFAFGVAHFVHFCFFFNLIGYSFVEAKPFVHFLVYKTKSKKIKLKN
jgi:hypothetical protein